MPSTERTLRLADSEALFAWADEQRRRWQQRSRQLGAHAADQLHPCTTLHYTPPRTNGTPLLLLGGMGPLAGLVGFERAHARAPQREIVFHQACALPCRTQAIENEARGDGDAAMAVVAGLTSAFDDLLATLGQRDAELVVLCNTVHHFLPRLLDRLPPRVRFHPLPCAAMAAARRLAPRSLLLLATKGTRQSGFYARGAEAAGLRWHEPDKEEQYLLQRAIFKGVKGGDEERLLADGDALLQRLARREEPADALLAGCTEIPLLLSALRKRGSAETRAYLDRVAVIDPVSETLDTLT